MPSAIDRIRSKNKIIAQPASLDLNTAAAIASRFITTLVESINDDSPAISTAAAGPARTQPSITPEPVSTLPPPIPCLFCNCPAIWFSIYEPTVARCCDCDPPPGGTDAWHWQRGGWAFVARRLMVVLDHHTTTLAEIWHWESLPRVDRGKEIAAAMAEIGIAPAPSRSAAQQLHPDHL
jgi:hypothetical protein